MLIRIRMQSFMYLNLMKISLSMWMQWQISVWGEWERKPSILGSCTTTYGDYAACGLFYETLIESSSEGWQVRNQDSSTKLGMVGRYGSDLMFHLFIKRVGVIT